MASSDIAAIRDKAFELMNGWTGTYLVHSPHSFVVGLQTRLRIRPKLARRLYAYWLRQVVLPNRLVKIKYALDYEGKEVVNCWATVEKKQQFYHIIAFDPPGCDDPCCAIGARRGKKYFYGAV